MRRTSTKKSGMKKIASNVAVSMPPITAVPIATRLCAPAPVAMQSGKHAEHERHARHDDRAQTDARRLERRLEARFIPCFSACSANSTIRIAFFAESPIVVSRPTWK
jgi:hypothetical protein